MADTKVSWFPRWIYDLSMPLWVTGPDGALCFWNGHAQQFTGITPAEALGHPCHSVVAALDIAGHIFCEQECRVKAWAKRRAGLGPFRIRVRGADGVPHDHDLVIIGLGAPLSAEQWLCHLALEADKTERICEYVQRVATRTPTEMPARHVFGACGLSSREVQITHLLSLDLNLKEIAYDLHISYFTVRNHLKSIREKLGVHSKEEIVACYLLHK